MNILLICLDYPPESNGGSAEYAKNIALLLSEDNQLHIITTGIKEETVQNGNIYIHRYKNIYIPFIKLPYFLFKIKKALKELICRYNIDVIHLVDVEGCFFADILPTVTSIHHLARHNFSNFSLVRNIKNLPYPLMEKIVIKRAQYILTDSELTQKELLKFYPQAKEKSDVFRCPIYHADQEYINLRSKYKLSDEVYIFLLPGILREQRKGGEYLIEALIKVNKKKNFICIFTGKSREGNWENRLKKLAVPVSNKIIFAGNISREELNNWYKTADAVIFPSYLEGYGLPVIEAMNFEKPVIATNTGEAKYFIKNFVNGILIAPKSSNDIRDAVNYFLKNPEITKKMGLQGNKDIKSKFDKLIIKNELLDIYSTAQRKFLLNTE